MLNNKGMSLLELLVTIILISIVLVFLFQLLTDLQHERSDDDFGYNNQVNRTEVVYTVEKDLNEYPLVGVADASTASKMQIRFYFQQDSRVISRLLSTSKVTSSGNTKYYIEYTSVDNNKHRWEMKNAEIDPCGSFKYYFDDTSNNYYFKLNIYLYNSLFHERNNKNNNNAVDDIEISFASPRLYLNTDNATYLTNNVAGDKNIGTCTN